MKIAGPPPLQPRAPQTPPPPTPPVPSKGDVFFASSGRTARTVACVGGFTNGGSLGYMGGALLAGSLGCTGNASLAVALGAAAGGGVVGWALMGKVSDWAAHKAGDSVRKQALVRTSLNLAVDLLSGSPITAVVDLGITAGAGAFSAWRAPKA